MPSFKDLSDAQRWANEHEALHKRERESIRDEVRDMNDAAIRHIERALEPVSSIEKKVDRAIKQNRRQSKGIEGVAEELKAAREERLSRKAVEIEDRKRRKRLLTILAAITPVLVAALAAWKGCH